MKLEPKFYSIICIGRLNPQILNHDFLLKNNILPFKKKPFTNIATGQLEKEPFDDYLSTPILSRIRYKNVDIVIEESRYQINDSSPQTPPQDSPIVDFTKNYFGVLKYTPLTIGGINFNSHILFDSEHEKISFEDKFIASRDGFYKDLGIFDFSVSITLEFYLRDPQRKIGLSISKPRGNELLSVVNFNCEFNYTTTMDTFLNNFDQIADLFSKYNAILTKMGVKC